MLLEYVYRGAVRIWGVKREKWWRWFESLRQELQSFTITHASSSCGFLRGPAHTHPQSSCVWGTSGPYIMLKSANVLLSCMFFFMDVPQLLFSNPGLGPNPGFLPAGGGKPRPPDSCSPSAASLHLSGGLLGIVIYTSRELIQTRGTFEPPRHHRGAAVRACAKRTLAGRLLNSCEMLLFPFCKQDDCSCSLVSWDILTSLLVLLWKCVPLCVCVCGDFLFFFLKIVSAVFSNGGELAVDVESSQAPQVPQVLTTRGESFMWATQPFTLCVRVETRGDNVSFRPSSTVYIQSNTSAYEYPYFSDFFYINLYIWCTICRDQRPWPLPY